jgi:cytochrome P450
MAAERFPPGPRRPGLLQAAAVARDPYGWMVRRWRRYGDCFSSTFPMFGRVVYVADPAGVKDLFAGDPEVFHAGEANARPLGPALGSFSLLTLDEDDHMRQRKLLLSPFHGERMRVYGALMAEAAERDLETWPLGEPFALRPHMQAVTLRVILRAVFGLREEDQIEIFGNAITRLAEASGLVLWAPPLRRDLGPWSPWGRFKRARAAVDELVYEEIARRRADPGAAERDDILSLLLQARHEDGSPMSDRELRDELLTLLTAGHETTATALSWAFERLVRNPPVLNRLVDEVRTGESDEYLDATIKETLRSRAVVTDIARRLTGEADVCGYRIPKGTLVLAAIAALHHRPDLYPEPEAFRPERFLEEQPEHYGWIPFGGGVRRCIGASFAQFEMKVVLRTILSGARVRAAEPAPERGRIRHVTVVPARGARVVLEERLGALRGGRAEAVPA